MGKILWKKHPGNVHEYQQPFIVLLEYSKLHPITKFLSDTRKQGMMPAAFRKYFVDNILPQAVNRGLKVGASISNADALTRFYLNMILRSTGRYNLPYRIFSSQQRAISWMVEMDY
jgi:hypothetical protein